MSPSSAAGSTRETDPAEASLAPITDALRVWVNGELHDRPAEARVSAVDHGLVVGDGVFEALKVVAGGPFSVQRHLDRLTRSAAALALPAPDHDLVRQGIEAVLADRDWEEGKIRITYTGGRGPLGSQAAFGPTTLVVAADSRVVSDPVATIVTVPWTRNENGAMAGIKSTSYAENVRGLAFATDRDADEAIFLNTAGHVCEGTGSNIFFVFGTGEDAEVVTPPLSAGPLRGVTRDLLLEWCPITERDLTLEQAKAADEVFITSSLRDVQAVSRWDETSYAAVGPVTARIARTFAERSLADLEP